MHREILLPRADGTLHSYAIVGDPVDIAPAAPPRSRVAYAAAHVVCDPLADNDPTIDADLDWEAALSYRRYLWSLGLSVAEAMDTAQREMGLGFSLLDASREVEIRLPGGVRMYTGDDFDYPDLLLSRAMMGDGPIQIRRIREAVDAAGYAGPIEVEIFNQDIWDAPGDEVLDLTNKVRHLQHA